MDYSNEYNETPPNVSQTVKEVKNADPVRKKVLLL